ncbi:MAG TPA: sugar phosphate isomerase/epimerase [Phototrophicaceae bacterium]|jgi:sugar phosphate isomerase/epimerase|nr:sugar phosphate isomerase/epimerase [Phototrophicaceae bacterium]
MPLAVQEHLLPGSTPLEKLQVAQRLGLNGVEFEITPDFEGHIPAIAAAVETTGVRAAAVNLGHTYLIHPEYKRRDDALIAMRQAMTYAIDLGAQGVLFKPFYSPGPVLPDLHPYKSALELEAELLVTQLRATLCDLAYALGTELLLQPVNHTETHLVRRVEHGAIIRRKLDNHPHLKLAPGIYHMQMEHEPLDETLRQFAEDTAYLHISDTNHTLPGSGNVDFAALAVVLHEINYTGWLTIVGQGSNTLNEAQLAASIAELRQANLV